MDRVIKLDTHDGSINSLKKVKGSSNDYELITVYSDYVRIGLTTNGEEFIDPSGGPMIIVGHKLACKSKSLYIVKGITMKNQKIIITLTK